MKPGDERGFVHKKLLGLAGKALGVAGGVLPGALGSVSRFGGRILTQSTSGGGAARGRALSAFPTGSRLQIPTPGLIGRAQRFFPGGASGFENFPISDPMRKNERVGINVASRAASSLSAAAAANGGVCPPRGMHLNKSSYFLRDGTFVEKGTRFVTNRKRNKSNGRANDNAERRLHAAEDQAKKILRATGWRTISKQSSREIRSAKKVSCK